MSTPPEEFTSLRRLLACKRHERPPPAYFDHLRRNVMSRLEGEELTVYSSWWQWLVEKFDARPILVCMYGVVVSGLLLAGFRLSQIFENEVAATQIFTSPWLAVAPGSSQGFPDDLEHNSPPEVYPSSFTGYSKSAHSVFGTESFPILLNEASRLPLFPISTPVSTR